MSSHWLKKLTLNCSDQFHGWLMDELGFETYLKYKLWDSESLVYYITVIRSDKIYLKYENEMNKVEHLKDYQTKD